MPSFTNYTHSAVFYPGAKPIAAMESGSGTVVDAGEAIRVAQPAALNKMRTATDFGSISLQDELPIKRPGFNQLITASEFRKPILWTPILLNVPRPRKAITAPISPSGVVDANALFEDPADPNKKFALPVFNLAEQTVSGATTLRVVFERMLPIDPINQKWQLTVRFGLAKRHPNIEDLLVTPSVLLRFTPPISGAAPKEKNFTVEHEGAAIYKATLQMTGLTERDQVVNALKSFEYQTRFIVRCTFQAAVPHSVDSNGVQLYRQDGHTVDVPLDRDPFVFDPAQAPYIFFEVQDASSRVFGLKLQQLEFKGRIHHYYQDEASPYLFYYLPDSFKVMRAPDPPYAPQIRVRFRSEDGSRNKMRASLEYVAAPVVDGERLRAARDAFKFLLPSSMPPEISGAVFQPLVVDDVSQLTLNLTVPRQSGSSDQRQARSGIVQKLSEGFSDLIDDLPMQDFQDIYDALFGKSSVIFTGDIQAAKSGDRPAETVPFIARLDDLYGRLLQEFEIPGSDGRIAVRLKNCIESPLTIRSIPVHILGNGQQFSAHIESLKRGGTVATFPVDLEPGEELALDVVPDQPLPTDVGAPDALFALDDVQVKPDADAVWNRILYDSVAAQYTREIHVITVAEWFAPTTNVMAVAIDFVNGDHVVLKSDHLEAKASVSVPVSDLILRKVQDSQYSYTQIVIRSNGQTRSRKTDTLDVLPLELSS